MSEGNQENPNQTLVQQQLSDLERLLGELEKAKPSLIKIRDLMKKQAMDFSKETPKQFDAILQKLSFNDATDKDENKDS